MFSLLKSKFIYSNSHIILGQTESFLKNIEKYGVPKNKLYYFPNWAEDIFRTLLAFKMRKKLGKKKNDFVILFAGNVGEAQGLDSVIEAAKNNRKPSQY